MDDFFFFVFSSIGREFRASFQFFGCRDVSPRATFSWRPQRWIFAWVALVCLSFNFVLLTTFNCQISCVSSALLKCIGDGQ